MNLEELYQQICDNIKKIKFNLIWEDFAPTKFALYNESECFFNGEYIEKTSVFVANTTIISRENICYLVCYGNSECYGAYIQNCA